MLGRKALFRLSFFLLLIASVAYSTWLLRGWLNPQMSILDSFSSELAAVGQPFNWVFRLGDATTAIIVGVVAFLWWKVRACGWLIPLTLGLFSLSTIADVLFPMACSTALSQACRIAEASHSLGIAHDLHVVTSVSANVTSMFFVGWALLRYRRGLVVPWIGAAQLAITALSGVTAAYEIPGFGIVQRLSTVLLVAWWIGFGWQIVRRGGIRPAQLRRLVVRGSQI
ncbi:MAG: DUF998 domain-containing protein [Actinomycetaceae bacterium]|nr:DUF998 domain-containing protein [Actinomycetaceae bacterium]